MVYERHNQNGTEDIISIHKFLTVVIIGMALPYSPAGHKVMHEQDGTVFKNTSSGARVPGFESELCHLYNLGQRT